MRHGLGRPGPATARPEVRTSNDVLFLRELTSGWRVAGAGCEARGERRAALRVRGGWAVTQRGMFYACLLGVLGLLVFFSVIGLVGLGL